MKTFEQRIRDVSATRELKFRANGKVRARFALAILVLLTVVVAGLSVRADDNVASEYQGNITFHHPITGDLTGSGHFEYDNNAKQDFQAYELLWPELIYSVRHWFQLSGGLISRYTDNEHKANTFELRPVAGVKLFVPNEIKWNFYNYTRYEYRDTQDLDTHSWTAYSRVRNQVGVEFPLASRAKAWEAKTWYGLADAEPIFRFDTHEIDPLYLRGGVGFVLSDRVRLEFVYSAEYTRSSGNSLVHTDNIFQLTLNIGLAKGILHRLRNPHAED